MLAVADGVGDWAKKGIDPGLFSKELTKSVLEAHMNNENMTAKELV